MSSLPYIQQLSKVIVAQITQTIGWNSIQTTPLELLTDILHKYLEEITRQTQRYTELYGRTEPNLDDVALAFNDLNINISDLDEYISNVDPVPCIINVPKFPIPKESNLNFLKPGSKEVVTRPVHVHEHLPPIFPSEEPLTPPPAQAVENHSAAHENAINEIQTYMSTNQITDKTSLEENGILHDECHIIAETTVIYDQQTVQQDNDNTFKKPIPPHTSSATRPLTTNSTTNGANPIDKNAVGKETREIVSCIMTTSGFISPAREGKLPEAKKPIPIIDDEPEVVVEEVREPTPPPPPIEKKHHSNKRDKESKTENLYDVDAKKSDVTSDDVNMNDDNRSKVKLYEVIQSAQEFPEQPVKKRTKKSQIDPPLKDQKKTKKIKLLEENQFKSKDELTKFNTVNSMSLDGNPYGYGMKGDAVDASSTEMSGKIKKKLPKAESLKKKHRKNREMATLPYPPNDNLELQEKQRKKRISKLSKKNLAAMGLNPNAIEGFAIPSVMDGSQNMSMFDRFAPNPYSLQNQSRLDGAPIQPKEGQKKTKQLEKLTNEPDKHKIKFLKKLTSTSSSMYAKSSDEINNRLSQSHSQFMNPTMDMHESLNAEHWPIKDTNADESQKYKPSLHLNTISPTNKMKALKKLNKPPKEPKIPKIKKESQSKKPRIPKIMDVEISKSAQELFHSSCSSSQVNPLFLPGMGMLEGINAPGILPSNPLFQSMRFDFQSNQAPNYPYPDGLWQRFKRSNFGDPAQNEPVDSKFSFANESPQVPTKPFCNVAPLMPPSLLPMEMANSNQNAVFANSYSDYSQRFEQKLVQEPINLMAGSSSSKLSATSPLSHSNPQLHKDDKRKSFEAPIVIDSDEDVKYNSMEQQKYLHSPSQDSQQDTYGGEMKRKKMKDKSSNSKKDKKDKEKKKKDKKDKLKSKKKDKERLKMANERIADGSAINKSIDDQMQTDWSRDVLEQRHETDDMNESTSDATIPKLTLKLPPSSPTPRTSRPSTPDFQNTKKISKKKKKQKRTMEEESDKSQEEYDDNMGVMSKMGDGSDQMKRESSPELARISALVTRPPKQKSFTKDNNPVLGVQREYSDDQIFTPQPITPSGRGRPKGSTSSLKSGKKSSKASRSLAENETEIKAHSVDVQSTVLDIQSNTLHAVDEQTNEENQVWICPACGRVDDGTPMIGCDGCDAWYHWVCVGIQVPPEQDQDWFCRVCISKKQEDKKKKRKKKDKDKH